ncbi:MAG: tetratricopeptide repeat protein, partial [Thermodesulfobacteriota bacterium]
MDLLKKILIISLSFSFLGGCAGRPQFQKQEREALPGQPTPAKTQKIQKTLVSNPVAYYDFVLSQLKLGDGKVDEAIEDLKSAITRDVSEPSLHIELATLYIQKGLLDEAVQECKTALVDDPDDLPAHLLLGGIYSIQKKYQ